MRSAFYKAMMLVILLCIPAGAQTKINLTQNVSAVLSPGNGGALTYQAYDDTSLATALSAAYTYTNTTGLASAVHLGAGKFHLYQQFTEPLVNGAGVSIIGEPGLTTIYMSAQNAGSPWEAMIYRGATSGNKGQFTISGLNLFCTDQANTTINALHGLELVEVRGQGMILRDVQVSNCGSRALGGEDVALGGAPNTDSLGVYIQNLSTDYNEGFYTGPAGGSGPTPPDNGIHFLSGMQDSHFFDLQARNGMQCGIRVDAGGGAVAGIGGLYFVRPHAFGYATSNPQNYFQQHAFCDYDQSGVDHWIDAYADSSLASGFDIGIGSAGIDIENPFFYWPGAHTDYPSSNMMTIASTSNNVLVTHPVCNNKPYSSTIGALVPITNNSSNLPVVVGGYGCGIYDQANYVNTMTPLNIGVDVTGYGLILGSGLNATNAISISGTRFQLGYYQPTGVSIMQAGAGKPFGFYSGNSFATGFLGSFSPVNGLGVGGSSNLRPNFIADLSGVTAQVVQTAIAAASTIAPTGAVTHITGTGTINTITPLSPVCSTGSQACRILLIADAGFTLGTSGNISSTMTLSAGQYVELTYDFTKTTWYIPSAPQSAQASAPVLVASISLTDQTAALGTTTLYTPSATGTYRISVALHISAVGTGGTIGSTIGVNNGDGGANDFYGTSSQSTTTLGGMAHATIVAHVGASKAITYATFFTSVTGTPGYGLDVVVEKLQ